MIVEVGSMCTPQQVCGRFRNEFTSSPVITNHIRCGNLRYALTLYHKMQKDGCAPLDGHTLAALLQACAKLMDLDKGLALHDVVARTRLLERDHVVCRALVHMYAKCGSLDRAQQAFDSLAFRNVIIWNALMTGYLEHGHCDVVLNCLEYMQIEGVLPDEVTYICSLKACGGIGATDKVRAMHAEIARRGLLERNSILGSTLLDVYAKCGLLAKAQEVFDKLRVRDVVLWTTLIAGYVENGHGAPALKCLEKMQHEGVSLDAVAFVCILRACGILEAKHKGRETHAEIARMGLLKKNFVVGSTLVDMYVKCGLITHAREVFDKLPVRNVVTWTTLIAGYAEAGHGEEALKCFEQMRFEGTPPNAVTFVCSLKACGAIGAANKGQEIHTEIERSRLFNRDILVANTLIDMYARCGSLATAQEVFDRLQVPDIVSWNALIAGYVEFDYGKEALKLFEQMQLKGVSPNAITFVCVLKACGSIGAATKGVEIHMKIAQQGLLDGDPVVGNTLIDMYSKCGAPALAQQVFDKLPARDVFSWNSLLAGHAQVGESVNVFRVFDKMLGAGITPGPITFIVVLNACSRIGLYDTSHMYFEAMSKEYGFAPYVEHHNCMVDILSRAGQLDQAMALIKKLPFCPDFAMWHTVLGACKDWGNVELGKQAFEHTMHYNKEEIAVYDNADYVCKS